MTSRPNDVGAIVNVDIVPMKELARQGVIRRRIRRREIVLRRIGKDDAKTERILEAVPLEDPNLVFRIGLFHQDAEVQRRGPAADRDDSHLTSCPAMMS